MIQLICSIAALGVGPSLQTGIGRLNFFPLRTRKDNILGYAVLKIRNSCPTPTLAGLELETHLPLLPLFWHSLHPAVPSELSALQELVPSRVTHGLYVLFPPFWLLMLLHSFRPVCLLCSHSLCLSIPTLFKAILISLCMVAAGLVEIIEFLQMSLIQTPYPSPLRSCVNLVP